jgi:myo-inositol-1(or 4)-monophosphatase
MELNELEILRKEVLNIVKKTGQYIYSQAGQAGLQVETKSENSLVTKVDKEAERQLVRGLQKLLPNASFITEEGTVKQEESNIQWIIDPLDGTTNFIQNIPFYSTSVALQIDGEIVLGVVNLIPLEMAFHAIKGGGAFQDTKEIKVSSKAELKESIVATGFPYERNNIQNELYQPFLQVLNNVRGMRRLGSAALDLAFVASGRMDAYFETNLNPWDVAAGILLVKEAGGRLSDYQGGNDFYSGRKIVASNGEIHDKLLQLIDHS